MKMKDRSHRYDINKPRSKQGHKCKMYLPMLMLTCIK